MKKLSPKLKTVLLSLCLGIAEFFGYLLHMKYEALFFLLFLGAIALVCYTILGRWRQRALMFFVSFIIQSAVLFGLMTIYTSSLEDEPTRGQAFMLVGYFFAVPLFLMLTSAVVSAIIKMIKLSAFENYDEEEE